MNAEKLRLPAQEMQTSELVEHARDGDREAFGQLFQRFYDRVYTVALLRLKNPDEANDIAQSVFLHAQEKIIKLRHPLAFGSWMCTIAIRMSINYLLRRKGKEHSLEDMSIPVIPSVSGWHEITPEYILLAKERQEILHEGMLMLKQADRLVIDTFHERGMTLLQIAEALSSLEGRPVPMGTVKRRLHVARNRLREILQDRVDLESV